MDAIALWRLRDETAKVVVVARIGVDGVDLLKFWNPFYEPLNGDAVVCAAIDENFVGRERKKAIGKILVGLRRREFTKISKRPPADLAKELLLREVVGHESRRFQNGRGIFIESVRQTLAIIG